MHAWSRLENRNRTMILVVISLDLLSAVRLHAGEYYEGFDQAGRPASVGEVTWSFRSELSPATHWDTLIPGDGFAHLAAERSMLKKFPRRSGFGAFQTLSFGPVTVNHRISMRAKNTTIAGLAAMLFTYREKDTVDEIDIEIISNDTEGLPKRHRTKPGGGWTDVRLVTWVDADRKAPVPTTLLKTPIRDRNGEKVSHMDDAFHTYTIEWTSGEVRFYIDGIHQHTAKNRAPDSPADVIVGLREVAWAGRPQWKSGQEMLVDWVAVEPLP